MDDIILIGKWRDIELLKEGGWVDGEFTEGESIGKLHCILNPMSAKFLKNFEQGKYTMQDMVAYSKQYIKNCKNATVLIQNKRGEVEKFTVDDVKEWDDSVLVKYLLKRVIIDG